MCGTGQEKSLEKGFSGRYHKYCTYNKFTKLSYPVPSKDFLEQIHDDYEEEKEENTTTKILEDHL